MELGALSSYSTLLNLLWFPSRSNIIHIVIFSSSASQVRYAPIHIASAWTGASRFMSLVCGSLCFFSSFSASALSFSAFPPSLSIPPSSVLSMTSTHASLATSNPAYAASRTSYAFFRYCARYHARKTSNDARETMMELEVRKGQIFGSGRARARGGVKLR